MVLREKEVVEPQREAIHQHATTVLGVRVQRFGQAHGLFDQAPMLGPACAVQGHAQLHLFIAFTRRGDIRDRPRALQRELFSVVALARAGATEDECETAGHPRILAVGAP